MFELFYPGRSIVLDSPLGVEEVTRRLEAAFDGTFGDGRFWMMRRVRGRNSFRSVVDGQILPRPGGSRLNVRLRLHPLILAIGVVFALIAGTVAAVASPEVPVLAARPYWSVCWRWPPWRSSLLSWEASRPARRHACSPTQPKRGHTRQVSLRTVPSRSCSERETRCVG